LRKRGKEEKRKYRLRSHFSSVEALSDKQEFRLLEARCTGSDTVTFRLEDGALVLYGDVNE